MTPSVPLDLQAARFLPDDGYAGTLVGRVWRADVAGPSVVAIREHGVYDLSAEFPTVSSLLEVADPARAWAACRRSSPTATKRSGMLASPSSWPPATCRW